MSAPENLSSLQFPVERLMRAYSTEYEGNVGEIGEHLDQGRVESYAGMKGDPPPVHLTQGEDGEEYMVNGHHRAHAAQRAGRTHLSGYLHPLVDDDYPTLQPEHLR